MRSVQAANGAPINKRAAYIFEKINVQDQVGTDFRQQIQNTLPI
jgi:hypothetical protein